MSGFLLLFSVNLQTLQIGSYNGGGVSYIFLSSACAFRGESFFTGYVSCPCGNLGNDA